MNKINVRARAPLRLGLAGGGTDLSPYCDSFGGAVLNATIDRFAYAHICSNTSGKVIFRAGDVGEEEILEAPLDLPIDKGLVLHRAVYRHMANIAPGQSLSSLTVSTTVDVPAGSGLGASSALVVALVEAFRVALQLPMSPYDVARTAFEIERVHLGLAGGRQDQYAAAFGGFNFIEFLPAGQVVVNPLRMRREYLNEFESALAICFSGQSRRSDSIIKQQVSALNAMNESTIRNMHQLKQDALDMKMALLGGDIRQAAAIMSRSWIAKKQTATDVTNSKVEELLDVATKLGAWGGKVSGAGGGGFFMFFCDPENRFNIVSALNSQGLQASAVKLTFDGAEAWQVPVF